MFKKNKDLLANKPGRCACGTKLSKGQCSHCDFECQKSALGHDNCKKCTKARESSLQKAYIEEMHLANLDLEVLEQSDAIREKSAQARNPFFFPTKDEDEDN
ncbi:MAG: hypothetical protein RLZZ340_603 [Actinomycetota bacterium]|jgi:hypothetical protein